MAFRNKIKGMVIGQFDFEEFMCSKCLLYPETFEESPALHIPIIADTIENISGFENEQAFLDGLAYSRHSLQYSSDGAVDVFLKVSQFIKDDELNNMTFLDKMRLAAIGEILTGKPIIEEEQPKKKKNFKLEGFDAAGLENAIKFNRSEVPLNQGPGGREGASMDLEQFTVTNTNLSPRE